MVPWSRVDGELVREARRRGTSSVRRRRQDSCVFFEQRIWASPGLDFLREYNELHLRPVSWFHLLVWALSRTLSEHPRLNRFIVGGRLYQRRGVWLTFSVRQGRDPDAGVNLVKQEILPAASIEEAFAAVQAAVASGRAIAPQRAPVLSGALERLYAWLDRLNLLPERRLREDPLHCSAMISNLGSLGLDAAFHPLNEAGTAPIHVSMGRVQDAVVLREDGVVGARPEVLLRWTFDERVEDGLNCAEALDRLRQRLEGRIPGEPLHASADPLAASPTPLRRLLA